MADNNDINLCLISYNYCNSIRKRIDIVIDFVELV